MQTLAFNLLRMSDLRLMLAALTIECEASAASTVLIQCELRCQLTESENICHYMMNLVRFLPTSIQANIEPIVQA